MKNTAATLDERTAPARQAGAAFAQELPGLMADGPEVLLEAVRRYSTPQERLAFIAGYGGRRQ
jgi:hypothetical protein